MQKPIKPEYEEWIQLGDDGWEAKPDTPKELKEEIDKWTSSLSLTRRGKRSGRLDYLIIPDVSEIKAKHK